MRMRIRVVIVGVAAALALGGMASASAPDSKRMERAKGFIADEQWARAIVELQAVADDQREANRDEALFWLAQSEHEMGDQPAAIQTLTRLERWFPASRWVRLGRSLRVEIAQRLKRDDVLWAVDAATAASRAAAFRPPDGRHGPVATPTGDVQTRTTRTTHTTRARRHAGGDRPAGAARSSPRAVP